MVDLKSITQLKESFDNTALLNVPHKWPHLLQDDIKNNSYYPYLWAITKLLNPRSYLEIGTLFGYSFMTVVSAMTNPKRALSLDGELYSANSQVTARANFESANLNIEGVEWRVLNTQQPFKLDETFDLIYIDGDHTFAGAYMDLLTGWDLLNTGGHMLVDDTTYIPEVLQAVEKFIKDKEVKNSLHITEAVRGLYIIKKEVA